MVKYLHQILYIFSFALAAFIFYTSLPIITHRTFPTPFGLSYSFSTYTAGLSVLYFYLTLLISPFYHVFHYFPGRGAAIFARKPLGIMAFVYSGLHGLFIILSARGGIVNTIATAKFNNQVGYITGIVALFIFLVLAVTSNDTLRAHLGPAWKKIQQFAYAAGILVLAHVLYITTHLGKAIPTLSAISFGLLSILMVMEAVRFEDFIRSKNPAFPNWIITIIGSLGSIVFFWWAFLVIPH